MCFHHCMVVVPIRVCSCPFSSAAVSYRTSSAFKRTPTEVFCRTATCRTPKQFTHAHTHTYLHACKHNLKASKAALIMHLFNYLSTACVLVVCLVSLNRGFELCVCEELLYCVGESYMCVIELASARVCVVVSLRLNCQSKVK